MARAALGDVASTRCHSERLDPPNDAGSAFGASAVKRIKNNLRTRINDHEAFQLRGPPECTKRYIFQQC